MGGIGRDLRALWQDAVARRSVIVLAVLGVAAAGAPLLCELLGLPGPNEVAPTAIDESGAARGPSLDHPLGADPFGHDELALVLHGGRVSLLVGLGGATLATAGGALLGVVAALAGGWVDAIVSRLLDAVVAMPAVLLALGLTAACGGPEGCAGGIVRPGTGLVIVLVALGGIPYVARVARARARVLRAEDFVLAARLLGQSPAQVARSELLPNVLVPVLVVMTALVPAGILLEATLTFVGAGVDAETPSWGQQLGDAANAFPLRWWQLAAPGLVLIAAVGAAATLGDRAARVLGGAR